MFFYNIMASHKTNKRSYKKRTPKRKTQKGGMKDNTVCNLFCKDDEGEGADVGEDEVVVKVDDVKVDDVKVDDVKVDDVKVDEEESDDEDEEESDDDNAADVGEADDKDKEIGGLGKKGRKSRKSTKKGRKPHKKNRKTMKKKKKSAWTTFVVDLYNKNKLKTKGYMFKNALSDAAKIYKK